MKFFPLLLLYLTISCGLQAQDNSWHGSVEAQGIMTGKDHVPFWMRSNQFGSVPLPGPSGSLIAAAWKEYDSSSGSLTDWGAGVEARGDLGNGSRVTLIQAYIKLRLSIFEFKGGRFKQIMGLVDTSLSSGAFVESGNALPMPKVQLAIPEFFRLPVFGGLFSFKGNFAQGWVGQQPVIPNNHVFTANTYYHQVSLYGRLGKPEWKLQLLGGLNHQVYWGNEQAIFGKNWGLSTAKTFEYVLLGKTYKGTKVGNHIGSIDLGAQYDFGQVRVFVYRQNFYDEGALYKLANIADGLNGISIVNKEEEVPDYYPVQGQHSYHDFHWHKIVLELFYSKNQAGYPWSKLTASGDENYYNSNSYPLGWSYKGMGLGNPFVTPFTTTRTNLVNDTTDFFNNNRVIALYGGLEGSYMDYRFTVKGSYSMNYGTYGTSPWGHSTGRKFYPPPPDRIWHPVNQFSAYLSVERDLDAQWTVGCVASIDRGGLFYNTGGLIFRVKRTL